MRGWKVALEPEGRTSSVTGGMQISIRGQDSKLSRDPTLKGNEVCSVCDVYEKRWYRVNDALCRISVSGDDAEGFFR